MSAHVLLNLFNKLKKNYKLVGLLNILSLFRKKLNKINNTGAQILGSIYHMTLKLLEITFCCENVSILPYTRGVQYVMKTHP